MKRRFRTAPALGMVVALLGLVFVFLGWAYAVRPIPARALPMDLEIERGTVGAALARSLQAQGLSVPAWALALALRWRGDAPRIRAGLYDLQQAPSLKHLLDRLTRGDASQREFALIEGWTFRQVREALARQSELRALTTDWSNERLLAELGAQYTHPEGLFAPDTYAYVKGGSDLDLLRRAHQLQVKRLTQAWQQRTSPPRGPGLASPYEALILASIIEKETARASDRGKVAAVFANRLRIGMRLQSDPTTIYGLGEAFDGNLRKRDLLSDTPWNTYTRAGLPPTPIAMPGRAALQAALSPEPIGALYFVARGDGSTQFSDDLDSHNQAVQRFQKSRRAAHP
jgi:UPF0755 protein